MFHNICVYDANLSGPPHGKNVTTSQKFYDIHLSPQNLIEMSAYIGPSSPFFEVHPLEQLSYLFKLIYLSNFELLSDQKTVERLLQMNFDSMILNLSYEIHNCIQASFCGFHSLRMKHIVRHLIDHLDRKLKI